jgi:hypothetical protein
VRGEADAGSIDHGEIVGHSFVQANEAVVENQQFAGSAPGTDLGL